MSPIIGTILLVSLSLALITILYLAVVVPVSPPAPYIGVSVAYSPHQPYYGDAGLCPPSTGACPTLPAVIYTISQLEAPAPSLSLIDLIFHCNNSAYLYGGLSAMTLTPSFPLPSPSSPQLATCGSFDPSPPVPVFDQLLYYQPLHAGEGQLTPGDEIVVYLHAPVAGSPAYAGAPPWCVAEVGACTLELLYTGSSGAVLLNVPLELPSPPS